MRAKIKKMSFWRGKMQKLYIPAVNALRPWKKKTSFKSSALEIFGPTKKRLDENDALTKIDSGKCVTIKWIHKLRRVLRHEWMTLTIA